MKKMKMSKRNQILFKSIFPGFIDLKKMFPWKGIISENFAFLISSPSSKVKWWQVIIKLLMHIAH